MTEDDAGDANADADARARGDSATDTDGADAPSTLSEMRSRDDTVDTRDESDESNESGESDKPDEGTDGADDTPEEANDDRDPVAREADGAVETADDATPATSAELVDVSVGGFYDALEAEGRPVVTAQQASRRLGLTQSEASEALDRLADEGAVQRMNVEADPVVYYPTEWGKLAERERVILFPERREIIVDRPTQYTRARLAQFAHLVDSTGDRNTGTRGYLYKIRQEDVWQAPFESLDDLLRMMRSVLPRRSPHLETWVENQWKRANQFRLYTHEDDYVVLEAASESLMGNVGRQKLDDEHLVAPISDTESWVRDGKESHIKRILYEAGYPVKDDRDLETGDPLDVDLRVELRDYQRDWVDRFTTQKAGVLVGPPGAGKTVTGIGVLAAVGGETLILVPSRELAAQWRSELLRHTSLDEEQIGEYHGGEKQVRPVTIATYQTAGMDRHRSLFDDREWGLIVYDEVHHVPSRIYRRSADLQAKHRLGLSATPIREDDKEKEIFTLIGPPIGTDWSKLFEAGYVQEPEVEIRYVPWADDTARNEWSSADGRERHQLAAMNSQKIAETRRLLRQHPESKALVFVDYLDQGEDIAEALDVPFVSGEMRHHHRERLFRQFREGKLRTLVISRVGDEGIDLPNAELAVVASGLGGSRRQGAQRAGRTMRPAGNALVYVLATRGTSEEDFAQRQMRHLAEKGVRVTESDLTD
ncbi:DNA/RNA helicase, superfamily ii [Halogeometricum pallidum JCM 14848]|uniref:Putative DNA 3'-5' helicase Rad25 n=1 Tax=Halogeometricum pallidum JCM 14848 TaxID=1227487 RepID=M0DJR6_HALPD|nr:DEAD/DEAH box helicase [Halogeometricum pallidum]ELZ34409.1 DNA/RNA helicase, superfamily ii [Halogeometricum pallidum JCM 14848]